MFVDISFVSSQFSQRWTLVGGLVGNYAAESGHWEDSEVGLSHGKELVLHTWYGIDKINAVHERTS